MAQTDAENLPVHIDFESNENANNRLFHRHNGHEIILITGGQATFNINGSKYICGRGSIVLISNYEPHSVTEITGSYSRYILYIKSDFLTANIIDLALTSILTNRPEGFKHVIHLNEAELEYVIQTVESMRKEIHDLHLKWEQLCASKLVELLIKLYRNEPDVFPAVEENSETVLTILRIQRYIDKNCTQDLKLTDIAQENYIEKYSLSRRFSKVTGHSFKEYLLLRRMSIAKDLLIATDKSVTEVAAITGFDNASYFIRIFKKKTGFTPLQYRKNIKNEKERHY